MKHMAKTIALLAACMLSSVSGRSAAVDFSDRDLQVLETGHTLKKPLYTSRQKGFYGGSGWSIIDAPANVVWKELQYWESYPEVFPKTVSVKELFRNGNRSLLRVEMGHKLFSFVYHLDVVSEPEKMKISFRLIQDRAHDIEDPRGYWRLFPQKDGRTLVAYVVAAQVPMGLINLIGSAMEEKIERHLLGMPGDLKVWIESSHRNSYHKMMAAKR
jgi:ribosome-associated toxin RatA of RatAB toxin-antitoxin module